MQVFWNELHPCFLENNNNRKLLSELGFNFLFWLVFLFQWMEFNETLELGLEHPILSNHIQK